jgi:hypothetical protein
VCGNGNTGENAASGPRKSDRPPLLLQFDLYRMSFPFRLSDQRLKARDDLTGIRGHPCCPTYADSERRIALVNFTSGERVPERIQIAPLPFRCAYRREITGNGINIETNRRNDFVNNINKTDDGPDAITGCSLLFIYYLFSQLGYTVDQIVAAGAPTLAGVYNNLTHDSGDPFPYFKALVDSAYPSTSTIAGPDLDNPFPLAMPLQVWTWDG